MVVAWPVAMQWGWGRGIVDASIRMGGAMWIGRGIGDGRGIGVGVALGKALARLGMGVALGVVVQWHWEAQWH